MVPVASSPATRTQPGSYSVREVSRGDVPEPATDPLGWTTGDRLFLWLALTLAAGLLGIHLLRDAQRRAQPVAVLSGAAHAIPIREIPPESRIAESTATDQPSLYRVEVNTSGWVAWTQLPGIGETLARRIVTDREERGPFRSVEDVARVRGIGPKTLDKLRPYLTIRTQDSLPGSLSTAETPAD